MDGKLDLTYLYEKLGGVSLRKWVILAVFLVVVACAYYIGNTKPAAKMNNVSVKAYFFYSEYCPHCKSVKSLVDSAARKPNVTYCCVDDILSGECYRIARESRLYGVPTLIVYGKERVVLVGEKEIRDFLKG